MRWIMVLLTAAAACVRAGTVERVEMDRATYRPGQPVVLRVTVAGTTPADVRVRVTHLGDEVATVAKTIGVGTGDVALPGPFVDGRGYLVEVASAAGTLTAAFDVATDSTRFPRYGYVTQYHGGVDAAAIVDRLSAMRINAIQYYDWSDTHHRLVPAANVAAWREISGREVSRTTLTQLISRGHDRNIAAMAYVLIYGAYDGYEPDGPRLNWGAFRKPPYSLAEQDRHELNIPGWETPRIHVMNAGDPRWQGWFGSQVVEALRQLPFDGVHADTLGPRGRIVDAGGQAIDEPRSYVYLLTHLRSRLPGKMIAINTVNNFALEEIGKSGVTDFIYSELWGGKNQETYADLKAVLARSRAASGGRGGRPMVIAGYVNYDECRRHSPQKPGTMNEASVLLADAAILANGGWHLELGDDGRLLASEYFPNRNMNTLPSTLRRVHAYYDFATAYENLLREDATDAPTKVEYDPGGNTPAGPSGEPGKVWTIAKTARTGSREFDVVHLINLQTANTPIWRDPQSKARPPTPIVGKKLRIHGIKGNPTIWLASPDNASRPSRAERVESKEGYVEFEVPRLEYWTMVWIERK